MGLGVIRRECVSDWAEDGARYRGKGGCKVGKIRRGRQWMRGDEREGQMEKGQGGSRERDRRMEGRPRHDQR